MLSGLKKRLEAGVLMTALIVPLSLCVFAFLGVACYFAFRNLLAPELAALVTAAAGIVAIALVLIIARIAGGSRRPKARSAPEHSEELERFLSENADPMLRRWIEENPDKAAITTLALGVAAGYSEQFRTVLFDFYARYADSEELRRSRQRTRR